MQYTVIFDEGGAGNQAFKKIYNNIFHRLITDFTEHQFNHFQPDYRILNLNHCGGCPQTYAMIQIKNNVTKKSTVVSFWDRSMDLFTNGVGWEYENLTHVIGGLGMLYTSDEIKEKYGITHTKFQYPLSTLTGYDMIESLRRPNISENRIRKAIFIGNLYDNRGRLYNLMKDHPLIEMYGLYDGFQGLKYYDKIKDYRIGISFNGNGELSTRDLEYMGLNIPIVRLDMKTQFYNPLIPNHHYIKVYESCPNAQQGGYNEDILSEKFLESIEKYIDDYDYLQTIANNGLEYFEYSKPDYIVNLFFKVFDISLLD